MDRGDPDPKREITITFNWAYDSAAVDGQVINAEQQKQFKYKILRISRREERILDATIHRYYSIEYGWIRPSIFSTLSTKIEYVRCARFKIRESVAVPTRAGDAQEYKLQDVGFYYFIDTTTTCGRDLGRRSDCDKNTQAADANLKNQILNVKAGYPIEMTADERESIIQQEEAAKEAQRAAITRDREQSAQVLAEADRYAEGHRQEQQRIIEERKRASKLEVEILAAIVLLRSKGYTVTVPQGGLPQGGLPQGGLPQGGRRTRRQSRRRKRSTKARR